jgi:TPR repeat protein
VAPARHRRIGRRAAAAVLLAALACSPVLGATGTGEGEEKRTLVDAAWEAYERGDYAAAVNGFELLAAEGILKAQTNLGYMYAEGLGVERNLAESAHWFRMAAEQGHVGAQATLGLYYYHGEGVEQDVVAAHAWFALAAAAGHPRSGDYQRLAAAEMSPEQLARSHQLAKELYGRFGRRANLW